MYIRRLETMNLCVPIHTACAEVKTTALLDSGANENFIDKNSWKELDIGQHPLKEPIKVLNVDGTENK
jgi:hypothetical protein